jgi:hypothetical protein
MLSNSFSSSLPDSSKIWFYFITRSLGENELNTLKVESDRFLEEWNTHGKPNNAEIVLLSPHLLSIAAHNDTQGVSGCSIDKSVAWIKRLGSTWNLDLLDRNWVIFENREGKNECVRINQFWAKRKALEVDDNTILWDNTIQSLGEFRAGFKKKFSESWHARMW